MGGNTDSTQPDAAKIDAEEPEEELDEPVLDGAEDHDETDVDPRKGMSDPALIRDVESGKKTANPYA